MVNVADYSQSNLGKIEIAPSIICYRIHCDIRSRRYYRPFAELKNKSRKISRKNLNRDLKIRS